jgi:hypothetical protein
MKHLLWATDIALGHPASPMSGDSLPAEAEVHSHCRKKCQIPDFPVPPAAGAYARDLGSTNQTFNIAAGAAYTPLGEKSSSSTWLSEAAVARALTEVSQVIGLTVQGIVLAQQLGLWCDRWTAPIA